MGSETKQRPVLLDGLRGVAAIVVLVAHTLTMLKWPTCHRC